MKMKKLFLGVLLIASAITAANAQTEASKWSIALRGGVDYFRVTPMSTITDEVFGSNRMARYVNDASWGAGLSIEKTLNPLFGLGLDVDYLNYNKNNLTGRTIDPTLFGSVNLTNLLFPHRTSAKFNLYSRFGAGAAFYKGTPSASYGEEKSSISPVGATNLLAEWNLSRKIALGLEGGYRAYLREDLGGTTTPIDKDKNNDAWTAMVNLRFKLGSLASHVRDLTLDQYYPAPAPVVKNTENPYDDSALVGRMNNADKKLGDIENRLAALEQGLKDLGNKPVGSTVNASFQNIEFEFNSAKLTEDSYATLNQIASLLKNNPTWAKLNVSGHTDNIGSDTYNQKLSDKRAKAVVDYLVSKGVSASTVSSAGYGESKPIATNATEEGRQKNRRVEFEIVK